MRTDYRVGDVLEISCPYTETRVTETSPRYVTVRWPWWEVDPECSWIQWNGDVALAADPDHFEWERELFRTEPPLQQLAAGDLCRVGIPPTVVHVASVDHFDPPRETGRLPRPRTCLVVLPHGQSHDAELEDQGSEIELDDGIPVTLTLLFRPYAFLAIGDEIADSTGRAWRFDVPWDWHPFDGDTPTFPTWPLTLLTRNGKSDDAMSKSVIQATRTGSHAEELARWTELTGATPTRTAIA